MANFKYTTNTQNNVKLFWGLWSRRGGGGTGFSLARAPKGFPAESVFACYAASRDRCSSPIGF